MKVGLNVLTTLVALVLLSLSANVAMSESLTFRFQSYSPYKVHLKFYSQDRNWVWPNKEEVWVLDDYEVHEFDLTCNWGERIAWGAWVSGNSSTYWGSGQGGRKACSDCVYTCEGGVTNVQVLNE